MNFDPADLVEANRIHERLWACQTAEDVEAVADDERAAVAMLREKSPEARVLAIQLANLKKYMIRVVARSR